MKRAFGYEAFVHYRVLFELQEPGRLLQQPYIANVGVTAQASRARRHGQLTYIVVTNVPSKNLSAMGYDLATSEVDALINTQQRIMVSYG